MKDVYKPETVSQEQAFLAGQIYSGVKLHAILEGNRVGYNNALLQYPDISVDGETRRLEFYYNDEEREVILYVYFGDDENIRYRIGPTGRIKKRDS